MARQQTPCFRQNAVACGPQLRQLSAPMDCEARTVASRPGPLARLRTSQPPSPPGSRSTDRAICPTTKRHEPSPIEPFKAGALAGRRFLFAARDDVNRTRTYPRGSGVCHTACTPVRKEVDRGRRGRHKPEVVQRHHGSQSVRPGLGHRIGEAVSSTTAGRKSRGSSSRPLKTRSGGLTPRSFIFPNPRGEGLRGSRCCQWSVVSGEVGVAFERQLPSHH